MYSFPPNREPIHMDCSKTSDRNMALRESTEIDRIHIEQEWRRPRILDDPRAAERRGIISKWTDLSPQPREENMEPLPDHYVISLALRNTRATFSVAGSVIHRGDIPAGMSQLTRPNMSVRAIFSAPCEFMHLFVKKNFISNCMTAMSVPMTRDIPEFDMRFRRDPILDQLLRSLTVLQMNGQAVGEVYMKGICAAIVARLISPQNEESAVKGKPKVLPLPDWRLKRSMDYVEQNIAEPITLAGVAGSTGLTRMYFAAQFRAATGLRPHAYILRRRIERAQEILLNSNATLVDTSLSVGFQTQGHFTTVFKKIVGQTPSRWREANLRRGNPPPGGKCEVPVERRMC
jgi:AraC-like DNA-binding protein